MELLESQRGRDQWSHCLLLSGLELYPTWLLPYYAFYYSIQVSLLETEHGQGRTDEVTTLAALNKAVGLTLLWEEARRPRVARNHLEEKPSPFSSTVATNCFPRAASQG